MGSGKYLKHAIQKYGLENFHKEIIYVFDNEAEMNAKEAELVVISEGTYNLCPGGKGGFGYLNDGSDAHIERAKRAASLGGKLNNGRNLKNFWNSLSPEQALNIRQKAGRKSSLSGNNKGTTGYFFSEESKKLMSLKSSGINGSQYGTIWITNGHDVKKIDASAHIPAGFVKGRKIKK